VPYWNLRSDQHASSTDGTIGARCGLGNQPTVAVMLHASVGSIKLTTLHCKLRVVHCQNMMLLAGAKVHIVPDSSKNKRNHKDKHQDAIS